MYTQFMLLYTLYFNDMGVDSELKSNHVDGE
jgi:hypothetical protein